MNNRNGEWCDHAMGWGKADSKGIEDGIRCGKDGNECMMQCKAEKSDDSMLLPEMTDDHIEGLAKGSEGDAGIEQDRQIACLYIDTANVLRAYIRLRKENAKLKDELKDAKATCSEDKCPFALDGLCDENKRLRNLLDSIKERVEKTDTDFDSMYYLEMMTAEDFESIEGLYETVKAIKELVK